ncbi:MAG: glycosyltransferase [Acidobacteriota bacterium]
MRLLFVLPAYEPAWSFGGVVRCMSSLCRGLACLNHEVVVFTTDSTGGKARLPVPAGAPVKVGGVTVQYFPTTFGPGSVWDSRLLVSELRKRAKEFDLVYISAVWQWLGRSAVAICRELNIPSVFGLHGSIDTRLWSHHRYRKLFYWHAVLSRVLLQSTAVHFTTLYERQQSRKVRVPSFVVPNGIDTREFRRVETASAVRRHYGIPESGLLALMVGRIDPKKRIDVVIKALAKTPSVYLLVVGLDDVPLAQEYRRLARALGLQDRIRWAGHQTGDQLVELYSAGDLLLMPSEDENFGMVVVEALACGTPVLVSPHVGAWYALAPHRVGMVVDTDAAAVSEALRMLNQNRGLLREWSERAPVVVQDCFSVERVAASMVRAFRDVLTGTRDPSLNWAERGADTE